MNVRSYIAIIVVVFFTYRKVAVVGAIIPASTIRTYTKVALLNRDLQEKRKTVDLDVHIHSTTTFSIVIRRLEVEYQSANVRIAEVMF